MVDEDGERVGAGIVVDFEDDNRLFLREPGSGVLNGLERRVVDRLDPIPAQADQEFVEADRPQFEVDLPAEQRGAPFDAFFP